MSRLSREKKREDQRAAQPAASAAAPIAVHVPLDGAAASVGGVPVRSAPGEEIQHAVLDHLHRIALATGHPVLATVTDERIGYVVPLQVRRDGSSAFTAEPLPAPPAAPAPPPAPAPPVAPATAPAPAPPAPGSASAPRPPAPLPVSAAPPAAPRREQATHVLRQVPEPVREPAPTFPLRAVSEPVSPDPEPGVPTPPTFPLRALPVPSDATPLGTATAPTGEFGPPPVMDAAPFTEPSPAPAAPKPAPAAGPAPAPALAPDLAHIPDPDPKPTPARGFDAVAEAVLGEDPRTAAGEGGAVLLAEPLARVNEAVKAGRIEEAAALAEATVTEASGTLGAEHPEVLRLRELTAYIAYLAGDALRAFTLSLELARIHRRAQDAEGAYGNVRSAASAWRAVRDPEQGLRLGRDLLDLWTELTAEDGPAADDIEQLESARARMGRLAERARRQAPPPAD
ncbi:tetratricopeptide repeat protein [Streptomyces naganishii]|uniref:Uncharacterized protein n=1 Tax=Streptomyces naganishii JCM 4654 TaxID=1306179 RepID=A0A918Y8T7_9ACTN|nr:tetratricopeptide repeat protein [Streptomyces naganishii]GHD94066.1 hypothetical protein GCM10010508_53300 [Streptomyces naganishii JCM 4654]